ncbi:MAG: hypothetical protein ACRDRH_14035 [Pseudonocardia sp.]
MIGAPLGARGRVVVWRAPGASVVEEEVVRWAVSLPRRVRGVVACHEMIKLRGLVVG